MCSILRLFGFGSSSVSSVSRRHGFGRFGIAALVASLSFFRNDLIGRMGGVRDGGVERRPLISFSLFEVEGNRRDLALAALAKRDLGMARP